MCYVSEDFGLFCYFFAYINDKRKETFKSHSHQPPATRIVLAIARLALARMRVPGETLKGDG